MKSSQSKFSLWMNKHFSEGVFILIMMLALFIFLALATYVGSDISHYRHNDNQSIHNAGGIVAVYIAYFLYFSLGYIAYLVPIGAAFFAWLVLKEKQQIDKKSSNTSIFIMKGMGFLLFLLGSCGFLSMALIPGKEFVNFTSGGIVGHEIAIILTAAFNAIGARMILFAMILSGITWLTGLSWIQAVEKIGKFTLIAIHKLPKYFEREKSAEKPIRVPKAPKLKSINPPKQNVESFAEEKIARTRKMAEAPRVRTGKGLPSLDLLEKRPAGKVMAGYSHQELETISKELEQHLLDFGIQADVVAVHPGPVITRFELQLAAGVKVSKLSALSLDLARSLSVKSVRVVEIIPGKTVVGLELPNAHRNTVNLLEVLASDVYQNSTSPLSLALGVDIAGLPMVVDLGKMPHLLVAGTTGSGKSVGINGMILSLLFKSTPEQVRLIMIDPKMLELSVYDGIPHLLTPVVTDMKEAASALRWCVGEMERRYRIMSSVGVRNLAGFNTKVAEAAASGEPILDPTWKQTDSMDKEAPALQPFPYIVVFIDELADMMMVVGKKVEQLIARIAQKARAAGIHLILATQRPSVDVLTGLIKSNIPTRMSFQVSSKIDSRTILDQQGAEQLLGHGDMLYLAPGTGAPLRVHGAFVEDREVHRVVEDWRTKGQPDYIDEITKMNVSDIDGTGGGDADTEGEQDALYDQAVAFVLETRKASISAIQRRFKIGYNRSACLVESMERAGLVGPLEGGSREVLVSNQEAI